MKNLSVFLLISLLVGCSVLRDADALKSKKSVTVLSLRPSDWDIQFSPGEPKHPAADLVGAWHFDIVQEANFPGCVQNDSCKAVHYVTTLYSGAAQQSISMTLELVTTGTVIYNGNLSPDNICDLPSKVRLFFERRGDNFTAADEFYRWWANPTAYVLGSADNTTVTVTVPLTPDLWSSVLGRFGNESAESLAGFNSALANLGRIGMTFGGGCFFGHGVDISAGGTARFVLLNYQVQ